MNPGGQRGIHLAMGGLGLVALAVLGIALIGLNLPPLIVLGLAVVGIALPIFMLKPEAGLHLFIILTFVESISGENQSLTVGKVAGSLILGGWLLGVAVSRRLDLNNNALVMAMMGFVAWSGLSIMQAYDNQVAIRQSLTYLQLLVIMLMVGAVVNTPERVHRILRTIVLATTAAASHGLLLYGLGMAQNTAGVVGNRNLMATYLTFAIPCAYLLYQSTRSPLERIVLIVCLPILFVALALTYSRTGIIALGIVIAMVGYRLAREQGFRLLGVTAVMFLIIAVSLPGAFYERVESIGPTMEHQEETFGMRIQLVEAGMRMISAHPITGVGAGNYPIVLARYGRSGYLMSGNWASHNTYVGLAAETGLPSLMFFLLTIGVAFRYLRSTIRLGLEAHRRLAYMAIAVETSLVAILVSGLSGNMEKVKFVFVFLGLVLSLEGIRRRLSHAAPMPSTPPAEPAGLDPTLAAAR